MGTFIGRFDFAIDTKNRVNVPSKFIKELIKEADITLHWFTAMDGCIWVFPKSAVEKFQAKLEASQFSADGEARCLQRMLANGGASGEPDAQGRITLTDDQRMYAGLEKNVVILGNFNRMEIWSPERLAAHFADAAARGHTIDSLAERYLGGHTGQAGRTEPS